MRKVSNFARTIDNHKNITARFRLPHVAVEKHQVIQNAARSIKQQAIALFAHRQVDHIHRHQAFKCRRCTGADQAQLAHVRDIEKTSGLPGVHMFSHQACRVLNRHRITGKRHHARTQSLVQGVQRRGQQRGLGGSIKRSSSGHGRVPEANNGKSSLFWFAKIVKPVFCPCCPLYLRDSPGDTGLLLRWADRMGQSLSPVGNTGSGLKNFSRTTSACQSFCLSVQAAPLGWAMRLRRFLARLVLPDLKTLS